MHAGEKFASSVLITEDVKRALTECIELAPLHNPPNLLGIDACEQLMPNTPMVGVFDTAFHQTMPPESYIYALPYEYYTKHGIRRYGFHGTSHKYVAERAAEILNVDIEDLKLTPATSETELPYPLSSAASALIHQWASHLSKVL